MAHFRIADCCCFEECLIAHSAVVVSAGRSGCHQSQSERAMAAMEDRFVAIGMVEVVPVWPGSLKVWEEVGAAETAQACE